MIGYWYPIQKIQSGRDKSSQLYRKSGSTSRAFGKDVIKNNLMLSFSSSVYWCCEWNIFGCFHQSTQIVS